VVINNSQVGHSGKNKVDKQALSKEEYLQVYDIVNNPDEVYYDLTREKAGLVFIRKIANGKCIKVCTRLNQKSRNKNRKEPVIKVTTIGKVDYTNISKQKGYKKIE